MATITGPANNVPIGINAGSAGHKRTQRFRGPAAQVRTQSLAWLEGNDFFRTEPLAYTLTNKIHCMFAPAKFHGFAAGAYEHMKPALQLASRFLQDDRLYEWWWHTVRGEVSTEMGIKGKFLAEPNRATRNPKVQPTQVRTRLNELAEVITYHGAPLDFPREWGYAATIPHAKELDEFTLKWYKEYDDWKDMDESGGRDIARHHCFYEAGVARPDANGNWRLTPDPDRRLRPAVLLAPMFVHYFNNLPKTTNMMPQIKRRELLCGRFMLAVALVHEVCHAIFYYPRINPRSFSKSGGIVEPYHNKHEAKDKARVPGPELGESWERFMFHGILDFTDITVDYWTPFHDHDGDAFTLLALYEGNKPIDVECIVNGENGHKYTVERRLMPMRWIAEWFREDHWSETKNAYDLRLPPKSSWKVKMECFDRDRDRNTGIQSDVSVTIDWEF